MTESAELSAPVESVFAYVDDLEKYPEWLRLVHSAVPSDVADPDGRPAWDVELRAKVGPFARSKRLRMVRSSFEQHRESGFERFETDGRDHAMWALRAEVMPVDDNTTRLVMHLNYDGDLWAGGGLLQAVLNDEIRRGRRRLEDLLRS